MLRATPQLSAHPRPCSGSACLMGRPRSSSPGHNRTHIGVCSPDTNRLVALTRILLDGSATLDAAPASIGHGAAIRSANLRVEPHNRLRLRRLALHARVRGTTTQSLHASYTFPQGHPTPPPHPSPALPAL